MCSCPKKPFPRRYEIYNFCRTYLGNHSHTHNLSDLCLGVEKILKEIMQFHYRTYHALAGSHGIYNVVRLFHGHHYYAFSLSESYPRVEKKIFKEIMHFYYMPQHKKPCLEGYEIYHFGKPSPCHN